MASCGYSVLIQNSTPCGASWRKAGFMQCIAISECNNDISQHLKSCKLVADDGVKDEKTLLLARAENGFVYCIHFMISISQLANSYISNIFSGEILGQINRESCLIFIQGVFHSDASHLTLTISPHHRDTYGAHWKSALLI